MTANSFSSPQRADVDPAATRAEFQPTLRQAHATERRLGVIDAAIGRSAAEGGKVVAAPADESRRPVPFAAQLSAAPYSRVDADHGQHGELRRPCTRPPLPTDSRHRDLVVESHLELVEGAHETRREGCR